MNGHQARRLRREAKALRNELNPSLPDVAYTVTKARITNNRKQRSIVKDHVIKVPTDVEGVTEDITIQVPDYENITIRRLTVDCVRNIYQTNKVMYKRMTTAEKAYRFVPAAL